MKAFRIIVLSATLGASILLTGCARPSEADARSAINAAYREVPQAGCWLPAEHATLTFPVHVMLRDQSMNDLAILNGLNRSGLATVATEEDPSRPADMGTLRLKIDLTDKGRAANVWDPKRGFCVGTPVVKDIVSINSDDKGFDQYTYDVTYTWSYDTPEWVNRNDFPKLNGMAAPVAAWAPVMKWSKTWHVIPESWAKDGQS